MALTVTERHNRILSWLGEEQVLQIDTLAERLGVSRMTIHRDLNLLATAGLLEKVHGGARLPDPTRISLQTCAICRIPVKPRLEWVITTQAGELLHACCAHCGLLALNRVGEVSSALLKDFLYERVVNVRQAAFVVGSRIVLCCEPGVLAFASQQDASDFRKAFGGAVLDYAAARHHLSDCHCL
jgi:DNA-binding transcriptional ArsR family regulator